MQYATEITVPKSWFGKHWEPRAFLHAVQRSNKRISMRRFFNDRSDAIRSRREAYAAGLFAAVLSDHQLADFVWLERGEFPDFHLLAGTEEKPFELVEADRRGRRRGEEYKTRPRLRHLDPEGDQEEARHVIPERLALKARKTYRPAPNLLVYVNLSTFARRPEADFLLAESVQRWAACFPSIWLLWGGLAIQLAPKLGRYGALRDPFLRKTAGAFV